MQNFKILFSALFLIILSACSTSDIIEPNQELTENSTTPETPSTNENEPAITHEPILHLFRDGNIAVNKVFLIDLVTGETVATHEFDEYELVLQIWDFDNGYYAVWVGYEDLWRREWRLRRNEGNMDTTGIADDDREYEEMNFRFVILDDSLNYVETIPFNAYEASPEDNTWIGQDIVEFIDDELVIYSFLGAQNPRTEFIRYNVHTGEFEVLFQNELFADSTRIHQFINDGTVLFTSARIGSTSFYYGVIDLTTEEVHTFETTAFENRRVTVNGAQAIFTPHDYREAGHELSDEVIVFNTVNFSTEIVQLQYEDALWAYLSYDGSQIVTVNHRENSFRVYDKNGEMVSEIPLTETLPTEIANLTIFPISENFYTIHTVERFGPRHLQFVILP